MPRFDGTGPNGRGPRTGRGMGNCPRVNTEKPVSQNMNSDIEFLRNKINELEKELNLTKDKLSKME